MTTPRPPSDLSREGKRFFAEVVSGWQLGPDGLKQLAIACRALDRADAAAALIAEQGMVIETRSGTRAHPASAIERDARSASLRALKDLNLAPEAKR